MSKIDKFGKFKLSTDTLGDDERSFLKCKTMIYFVIDAVIMSTSGYILVVHSEEWERCEVHFFEWLCCVFGFNTFSFLINVFTFI